MHIDQLMNKLLTLKLNIRRATFFEGAAEDFNVAEASSDYQRGLKELYGYVGHNHFKYDGYTYRIDWDMLYTLQLWQLL